MARRPLVLEMPALGVIDLQAGHVGRQIVEALRSAISSGELAAHERLPSSRVLARSMGVSRSTVTDAYEQLIAEGCLMAHRGSGTRVAFGSNSGLQPSKQLGEPGAESGLPASSIGQRYLAIADMLSPLDSVPFSIAVPEGEVAMGPHWRRLSKRVRASTSSAPSGYPDPQGLLALRQAIASYLRKSRAVRCDPAHILITEGSQQGLYLAAKVLLSPGDPVWVEDPAYGGLTAVLDDRGAVLHATRVDAQGFDVASARQAAPEAVAAFVTPSHQFPMGMPLSMPRRLELVEWARAHGRWIVEDDYDSELRYTGQPFPAMQGLAPDSVIYLGTFSKILAPSLRLGYIVAPESLIKAFVGARSLMGRGSPSLEQHVLAAYMAEGYFEAHIRRIRTIYAQRRQALVELIEKELPCLTVLPADQGMHLVVTLAGGLNDVDVANSARKEGIALRALSPRCAKAPKLSGLLLGFGGFSPGQLATSVRKLRMVLESAAWA
ncbi:PLP-dependent aminotransferase family protein [Allohahella sp. A8]|uniref:MocR-like pyridoxine biosynthesis transcription factor PdxR n=1 Tax=Allohahella sp. A8 TaxID=3141461 RepID=UPI003A81321E